MNLSEAQIRYLATLETGQAISYTEGMNKSVLLTIPLTSAKTYDKGTSNQDLKKSMSSFWLQNEDLLYPYSGCLNCYSVNRNRDCGVRISKIIDTNMMESFLYLFNNFRLNKTLVYDSYLEFEHLNLQSPNQHYKEKSIYCQFVEIVDSHIERRGEYWDWYYVDIQKAINHICKVVFILTQNVGKSERKVIEKEYSKPLTIFSNLFKRLHKIDHLPFPGCCFCNNPCNYRFDMSNSNNASKAKTFQAAYFNIVDMDELASISMYVSNRWFHPKDIRSRLGASLCFAVQQFSEIGISRKLQEDEASEIIKSLKKGYKIDIIRSKV